MAPKQEIKRSEVIMVVVPCPHCSSWFTDPVDKERTIWSCSHLDCRSVWTLRKHYALVLLKSGEVIRVDERHPASIS